MGSGFKDWSPGDVLTAADVDGYLMRQTVMTFADASARDTALSGVLDEGMVAYLEDTNAITVYNGSSWVSVIDSDVLTVDTANNRVGINDSTPSYALDVTGDINATSDLRIGGTAVGTWTQFTPAWTNFTPGNATENWWYSQINDVLHITGGTVLGSTSSMSTNPEFDIPVGTNFETGQPYGVARYYDGSLLYTGYAVGITGHVRFSALFAGASYLRQTAITSSVPHTWTTGNYLAATFTVRLT